MKKCFFFLLTVLATAVVAQKKTDSIILKNGKTVSGIIYKLDAGKIYLARTADSLVYTADEVQSMMFCSLGSRNNPCADAPPIPPAHPPAGAGTSKMVSTNASTFSSFDDTESPALSTDREDAEKGTVVFKCNMCGNKGTLTINGENGNNKSKAEYTFTMEKEKHFFVYAAKLLPGEYSWNYRDNSNNASKGKLLINKGDEKKIVLFEKE